MAITFVGSESVNTGIGDAGATTSFSVNVPAAVVEGDQLVLSVGTDNAINVPADLDFVLRTEGWEEVLRQEVAGEPPSIPVLHLFFRRSRGVPGSLTPTVDGEPSSYTVNLTTAQGLILSITAYRGCGAPVGLTINTTTTGVPVSPSVTTTVDNEFIVCGALKDSIAGVMTVPGTLTQRVDEEVDGFGTPNGARYGLGDQLIVSPVATGTRTWTASSDQTVAFTYRLQPAPFISDVAGAGVNFLVEGELATITAPVGLNPGGGNFVRIGPSPTFSIEGTTGQIVGAETSTTVDFTVNMKLPTAPWLDTDWLFRRPIQIDVNQVSAAETNIPILVLRDTFAAIVGQPLASGFDFRFTEEDGVTEIPYERTFWDSATGGFQFWVLVPVLSGTVNTTIYMYFGNPTPPSDGANPTAVWATDFHAVWHLGDDQVFTDSAATPANLTNTATINATGQIGEAREFDTVGASLNAGSPAKLDNFWAGGATLSGWVFVQTNDVNFSRLFEKATSTGGADGFIFFLPDTGALQMIVEHTGTDASFLSVTGVVTLGAWHHFAVTYDTDSVVNVADFYLDGVLLGIGTNTQPTGTPEDDSAQDLILGNNFSSIRSLDGLLDEMSVASVERTASWIATTHQNQLDPLGFIGIGLEQNAPELTFPWFDNAWSHRKRITVQSAQVAGTSHTDFPLLVNLSEDDSLSDEARSDGFDILFTDDLDNQLDHEIERFVSATGELIAWVRIPSLSATADQLLFMYYGNPVSADQQDVPGTWESNFVSVYHLGDGLDTASSTGAHNGVNTGTTNAVDGGQMGDGAEYDGTNGTEIDLGNAAGINNIFLTGGTLSVWMNPASFGGGNFGRLFSKAPDTAGSILSWTMDATSGRNSFVTRWSSGDGTWTVNNIFTLDIMQYMTVTYSQSSTANVPIIYRNGIAQTLSTSTQPSGSPSTDASFPMRLGNQGDGLRSFDGIFDEARISTVVRDADWILTEYNNQSSPSTFYVLSSEELLDPASVLPDEKLWVFVLPPGESSSVGFQKWIFAEGSPVGSELDVEVLHAFSAGVPGVQQFAGIKSDLVPVFARIIASSHRASDEPVFDGGRLSVGLYDGATQYVNAIQSLDGVGTTDTERQASITDVLRVYSDITPSLIVRQAAATQLIAGGIELDFSLDPESFHFIIVLYFGSTMRATLSVTTLPAVNGEALVNVGYHPEFLEVWGVGVAAGATADNTSFGVGMCSAIGQPAGLLSQFAFVANDNSGVGTSAVGATLRNDAAFMSSAAAGTIQYQLRAEVNPADIDIGYRWIYPTAAPGSDVVATVAWKFGGLRHQLEVISIPTAAGPFTNPVPFQMGSVLQLASGVQTINTDVTGADAQSYSVGQFDGTQEGVVGVFSQAGVGTANTAAISTEAAGASRASLWLNDDSTDVPFVRGNFEDSDATEWELDLVTAPALSRLLLSMTLEGVVLVVVSQATAQGEAATIGEATANVVGGAAATSEARGGVQSSGQAVALRVAQALAQGEALSSAFNTAVAVHMASGQGEAASIATAIANIVGPTVATGIGFAQSSGQAEGLHVATSEARALAQAAGEAAATIVMQALAQGEAASIGQALSNLVGQSIATGIGFAQSSGEAAALHVAISEAQGEALASALVDAVAVHLAGAQGEAQSIGKATEGEAQIGPEFDVARRFIHRRNMQ